MKHSIKNIFHNLSYSLIVTLSILIFSFIFVVEQYHSYAKIDILKSQKEIITQLQTQQQSSNKIDIIQFNAKIAQLVSQNKILYEYQDKNYLTKYIYNDKNYATQLDKIHKDLKQFNKNSRTYFDTKEDDEMFLATKEKIKSTAYSISNEIDKVIMNTISYDKKRFDISSIMILISIILYFIITIWYKNRLTLIYKDIKSLFAVNSDIKSLNIFSQEIDAISMRMKRKVDTSDNPAFIDQITQINNNKGMLNAYTFKKGLNETHSICIAVIEIDNFSKSKRSFSQEFTQTILKKVAYTISLYEQATDIIARTDYNQFTLILSRSSTEQLFKDVDVIRQSISEIKLSAPDKTTVNVTVTGGFVTKPKNAPLEEAIKNAKELLNAARHVGINRIFRIKDLPKSIQNI